MARNVVFIVKLKAVASLCHGGGGGVGGGGRNQLRNGTDSTRNIHLKKGKLELPSNKIGNV
jgi:hypothetical protein